MLATSITQHLHKIWTDRECVWDCCYLRAQQLLNNTVSGTPYADRDGDACVLARKAEILYSVCMIRQRLGSLCPCENTALDRRCVPRSLQGRRSVPGRFPESLSCPSCWSFPSLLWGAELPLMCREAGLKHWRHQTLLHCPSPRGSWGIMCVSKEEICAQEI